MLYSIHTICRCINYTYHSGSMIMIMFIKHDYKTNLNNSRLLPCIDMYCTPYTLLASINGGIFHRMTVDLIIMVLSCSADGQNELLRSFIFFSG